jgi:LysM repeat protein
MATKVKVKPGDNMSALAAKAGVSLAAMKAANPQIANPSLIRPGQVLNIPAAKPKAPVTPKPVTPTPVAPKPVAPTSGLIPGFTPYITPDPDAKKPGDPGFVGPVATKTTRTQTTWTKAGTVQTLTGPVDVDANGFAQDGSVPIAKSTEPDAPLKEERTMAIDTFKRTLALFFGETEMTQPWVTALYGVTSKYYKTGSTIDESLNLALQDVRNNPELAPFTKRFKGVYELQDLLASGLAVSVPTISEFFKSQVALGEVMNRAGLQDLAKQEFLGDILGTGKSVAETTALINEVFTAIDNAPDALKADLQRVAPGADRTSIAKAILMGKEGAAALNKQIAATSVFSAAKSQGLAVDMTTAADYAARGFGYGESLTGFGNVVRGAAPLEKLTEISTGKAVTPEQAQKTMQQSIFENNVNAQEQIRLEAEKEAARFASSPGTAGSRSLASRNRADRAI